MMGSDHTTTGHRGQRRGAAVSVVMPTLNEAAHVLPRIPASVLRVCEVPGIEAERRHGVSNLRAFRDSRRVLHTILAERLAQP